MAESQAPKVLRSTMTDLGLNCTTRLHKDMTKINDKVAIRLNEHRDPNVLGIMKIVFT